MVNLAKGILCALLALLVSCNRNTNFDTIQANNDSIQKYLALAAVDSLSSQKRNQYNDRAFSLIALEENDTLTRYYLSETTFNNLKLRNWNALKKTSKALLQKATTTKDTLNLARYYRYTAGYYKHNKVYDSAFYCYSKAEKLYRKLGNNNDLGNALYNKGTVQFFVNDFLGAESSLTQAEFIFKKHNNKVKWSEVLISIGAIYIETKQNRKALKVNLAALDLLNQINLNAVNSRAICFNNIGNSYTELNNLVLADYFLNEALGIKELQKTSPGLEGTILFNMANLRIRQKRFKEVNQLFAKALLISQKHKEYTTVIGIHIGLSDYYSKVNDTVKAIEYAQKAKNISIKENIQYALSESLQQLIKVDTKNASAIAQQYIKVNDNLQQRERQFRDKFARIALETDEIQLERDLVVKQKGIIISTALGVFFIGLLLFVITKQRSKQKELLLRQSQQKANEEIYQLMLAQKTTEDTARQTEKKRIAMELHDGIMNKLTSTRLNLFVLSHRNDPETIASCLIHISQIHNIEQEIRNIAHNLSKDVFKETNSFVALLEEFVTNQNTPAKAQYALEVAHDIDWNSISSEVKMNMYRIVQEASQNANKYSNATQVNIAFVQDFDSICISIIDNGVGFDPKTNIAGIGIQNMRQRVLLLKGKFTLNSFKNNYTSINITIPMQVDKKT